MYEIVYHNDHVEVLLDGEFQFSADTISEAQQEIESAQQTFLPTSAKW